MAGNPIRALAGAALTLVVGCVPDAHPRESPLPCGDGDCKSRVVVQLTQGGSPTQLILDKSWIYFASALHGGSICRVPEIGGDVQYLDERQSGVRGLRLDEDGTHLYYARDLDGAIGRIPAGGGDFEPLIVLPQARAFTLTPDSIVATAEPRMGL